MTEKRTKLFDEVYFTHIPTDKYETARLTVNFICPMAEDTVTGYTLLMSVLRQSSAAFPSFTELNRALSDLYGAVLYSDSTKIGDMQVLSVGTEFLKEGMSGEDLSAEAVKLLCGMLFSPKVSCGSFCETDVETEKENLREEIRAEINDKRRYAARKSIEMLFSGTPFSLSVNGNEEKLDEIDGKVLYGCYNRMLKEAAIEIVYDGNEPDRVLEIFSDRIKDIGTRSPEKAVNKRFSPGKGVVRDVEKMNISQSKQVLIFGSCEEDATVMKLLNGLFGGTAFSKLFLTVREKMSLCYYCNSAYVRSKNIIMVESGVDNGKAGESERAILSEFEKIKSGEISDSELENTKKYIVGLMKSLNDAPSAYFDRLLSKSVLGGISVKEEIDKIEKITKEEVVSAANKTVFCGSFLLEGAVKK